MSDKDFYIGWMPAAPASFAKHTKRVVLLMLLIFITIAIVLGLLQKKFSNAVFEFGKLTELKGVYLDEPVPSIKVVRTKNPFDKDKYITIPLVCYGKAGAVQLIRELEAARTTSFDKREIVLRGTLLYNDGKTLLQIDKQENPLISIGPGAGKEILPVQELIGTITLKGEVVDPKCYFGVMKPGEGKPHKDCAIRCLSGGIPPVMHVVNARGEDQYYLLRGSTETITHLIRNFIAEPVSLTGKVVKQDDWMIIYLDDDVQVKRISRRDFFVGGSPVSCLAAK
jgi:hypothetical protein